MVKEGYLPEIDPQNPPPIEHIRQTLVSQDILTQANDTRDVVMVPRGWVDPENTNNTAFHKGKLENGVVVLVERIDVNYRDSRKAMKELDGRVKAQRIADRMTPEDLIPTSKTLYGI